MKAVLFDVYGTLISTGNGSVKAAERILRKNASDIDPETFYTVNDLTGLCEILKC